MFPRSCYNLLKLANNAFDLRIVVYAMVYTLNRPKHKEVELGKD